MAPSTQARNHAAGVTTPTVEARIPRYGSGVTGERPLFRLERLDFPKPTRPPAHLAASSGHWAPLSFREAAVGLPLLLALIVLAAISVRLWVKYRRAMSTDSRQKAVFSALGEGVYGTNARGTCIFINPAALKMLGYVASEVLGKKPHNLFHFRGSDRQPYPWEQSKCFKTIRDGRSRKGEEWFAPKGGSGFPAEVIVTPLVEAGNITGSVVAFNNISERKAAESELRKLSLAVDQSPESIVITDDEGRIEYVNQACVTRSGYSREELLGADPRIFQSRTTGSETYEEMWQTISHGRVWRGELVSQRKDGRGYVELTTMTPVRDPGGTIRHYLALKQDVSELKRAEAEIHRLAFYDLLTGLPNRTLLVSRLSQLLENNAQRTQCIALLLVNIDRFKTLNDAGGQPYGDQLLKAIGKRLNHLVRDNDTVARLGADEFGILMLRLIPQPDFASRDVLAAARRIHRSLEEPFHVEADVVKVTAAVGITLLCPGSPDEDSDRDINAVDSAQEMLRRAAAALSKAKKSGGNQTAFFEAGMDAAAQSRFQLERELRQGITAGELRLFLQPQVTPRRQIVGFEALVRWQHPERGLISPGLFISVAEESDLIVELGEWVTRRACELVAEQTKQGKPFHVSVNISPRHFRRPRFVPWLKEIVDSTEVDPSYLTLEMTEGLMIDNDQEVVGKMRNLQSMGIRFSVDDFGTGYSSLSYLKRLPIHELKIDKSFIQDAPTSPDDAALVETILKIAETFGLKVVAEGVETAEHAAFLNARAEIIHQGYLYGKPGPAEIWLKHFAKREKA